MATRAGAVTAKYDHRLLIRETERHLTDPDVAAGFAVVLPYGERLVYAAAFPLTL